MAQILLVDDEPAARWVVADLLAGLGHGCVETQDGLEAVGALRGREIDLVISDIRMPRMDGFALLRELRPQVEGRIPFVFLSGHSVKEDIDTALASGAFAYLVKPCDGATFAQVIERALESRRIWTAPKAPVRRFAPRERAPREEVASPAVVGRSRIVHLRLPPKVLPDVDAPPPAADGGILRAAARLFRPRPGA